MGIKGIIARMPEQVYVSYEHDRTLNNEFYITLYKEFVNRKSTANDNSGGILTSPTVYVKGFEKLFRVEQDTPEKQKEQLVAAARHFINSLVFEKIKNTKASDWIVDYQYDDGTQALSILFKCANSSLDKDFGITFSTNSFVCTTFDTTNAVTMVIHTEGFEGVFDDAEDYRDYNAYIMVQYAPCIMEFTAQYDNASYIDSFYVNPAFDKKVKLSWKIHGNGIILHSLKKGDLDITPSPEASEAADEADKPTVYNLTASNNKGFSDTKQIQVFITKWHKAGRVSGLVIQDASFTAANNTKLFRYQGMYYCYIKDSLYSSNDGCKWSVFSKNNKLPAGASFDAMACGLYDGTFYVMAGARKAELTIMRYSFNKKVWEYSSANQNCISMDGALAFSAKLSYYAQTIARGLIVCGHDCITDWKEWNSEGFEVNTQGSAALCGDLCFWNEQFYAVILCESGYFYLYECSADAEEPRFCMTMDRTDKITLLPTINKLLVAGGSAIYDTNDSTVKDIFPMTVQGEPWLGSDSGSVFGVFPDGNFWTYTI